MLQQFDDLRRVPAGSYEFYLAGMLKDLLQSDQNRGVIVGNRNADGEMVHAMVSVD
ncbi:protein of unknown function [Paraburkholderia dioscoreae]|uniref:Uncharacterized protein n=1 Tax=Paraburkholderia dioscoreae TaxID=2604047 RepID=A0A5Q4ZNY1_9BURK|nr:protein of unknown function [Paraburkholderia dioscoreae]